MKFEIKTVSEANCREHWAVKAKRKNRQQGVFAMLWRNIRPKPRVSFPATITFTRYSCSRMDSDNLAGAFKHVRDQLARELRIDDGDERIEWRYRQEKTAKREHYFTLEIA